jgi:hypothetical protein
VLVLVMVMVLVLVLGLVLVGVECGFMILCYAKCAIFFPILVNNLVQC